MRNAWSAAIAVTGLALAAGAATAQVPGPVGGVALEFAGLYATLSGSDFQGINAGFGGDAQVRFGGRLSLGLGAQYTSHGNDVVPDNSKVIGIFAEPRITFHVPASPITPYVGARVGWMNSSISSGGTDIKSSGYEAGATGGVMFRAGPMVQIVLAAVFASVHFGDQKVNGASQANSDTSGSSLAIRAGVRIGLGH